MVEFALVLPIAVMILALAATGGQMLMTDISLTQAARAGANSAAQAYGNSPPASITVQTTDATVAAQDEQGGAGSIQCSGAPAPGQCVQVTDLPAPYPGLQNNVVNLVQVKVWETISPLVPIFGGVTIEAEAVAPQ